MDIAPDKPLVAVISRLVPQKGIHLIEHSVGRTVSQGGQFVLLGNRVMLQEACNSWQMRHIVIALIPYGV